MVHYLPLVEFPIQLAVSHLVASRWFPFYSSFTTTQKCEWLAWVSTVLFQTTFTAGYLYLGWEPIDIGIYFLGHIVYDTAFLFTYNRDPLMIGHHLVAGALCVTLYFAEPFIIAEIAAGAALLERSNILLGFVWLLNRAGYGKTLVVQILGALALGVYLSLRLYWFPLYVLLEASTPVAWALGIFLPMNVIWSWKLVTYYYHIAFATKSGSGLLE